MSEPVPVVSDRIEEVKEKISERFCGRGGVHAVGIGLSKDKKLVVRVFLEDDHSPLVPAIQREADEFSVEFIVSPPVKAFRS